MSARRDLVVTYAITNRTHDMPDQIDLCLNHNTSEAAGYMLADVRRGAHEGSCDVCERIARAAEAQS